MKILYRIRAIYCRWFGHEWGEFELAPSLDQYDTRQCSRCYRAEGYENGVLMQAVDNFKTYYYQAIN